MKNLTLLFFILFSFVRSAQTEKDIEALKSAYTKATSGPDSLDFQKLYFDAFPKTFVTFRTTFGYFDHKDPQKTSAGALSIDAEKFIALFFRLRNVPDAEFYTKLINIGSGAQWFPLAENLFQIGLRKKILQNPQLTFELLKNEKDTDVESFWLFFFSGKHEVYKEIPEKLRVLKSSNEKIYNLLEKGFKASQKN